MDQLQAQGHRIKVLYVSGYTGEASIPPGDLPPGSGFLQKPFTLGPLLNEVKAILALDTKMEPG